MYFVLTKCANISGCWVMIVGSSLGVLGLLTLYRWFDPLSLRKYCCGFSSQTWQPSVCVCECEKEREIRMIEDGSSCCSGRCVSEST